MNKLTHFDAQGQAQMVDVGNKDITRRSAIATGTISMQEATYQLLESGGHKKGDVIGIARIAGIMAAKNTAHLIPLCHPIMLTHIKLNFSMENDKNQVICTASTQTTERTGVEMEALTAVNIALLTIYDMCKAVDRNMVISDIKLIKKTGGKSGHWEYQS